MKAINRYLSASVLFVLSLALAACDAKQGEARIKNQFPDYEIIKIPGSSYEYLLKSPEGQVFYGYSDGFVAAPKPEQLIPLFKGTK